MASMITTSTVMIAMAKEKISSVGKLPIWPRVLTWFFLIQSVAATKILLSPNWTVSNNDPQEYSVVGQAKFKYLTYEQTRIQSQNESFCLGFLRYEGSEVYSLSIIMVGANGESGDIGMQVWSANRDNLVRQGATLSVNNNGNLELLDIDNKLAWSPQIASGQVAAMELLDTGNLVIYDSSNNTLWQSFEHPTNVLLPGQNLTLGMKLVSNLSCSDGSSGYYSMVMEENGLAFYENMSNNPMPYNMWSFWGPNVKATNPPCSLYRAVLVYNMSGAFLQAVNNTGPDRNDSQVCKPIELASWTYDESAFGLVCSETCRRFMRLESDGNMGSYFYFDTSKKWKTPYHIFTPCQLPGSCGPYGVCSKGGQCTCPNPPEEALFKLSNFSVPSQGCNAENDLNCSPRFKRMVEVTGLNYLSNSYVEPLQGIKFSVDCMFSCLFNCSCKAAFFLNTSLSCYHIQDVRTLYQTGNDSDLAFLKVQDARKPNRILILGAPIGLPLLLLFCLVSLAIWLQIRRTRQKLAAAVAEEESALKGLPGLPPRLTFKDLEKATNGFSRKLGKGGFGSVYEGTLADGKPVAVKKLESSTYAVKQFLAEVATLGSISHINLVRLCGFCLEGAHHMLVYELVQNSSLDKWLFREDRAVLNWKTRFRIALGTARGLAYLHEECRDPIIHLDIKPQNILLDNDFTAKVADFGLSRLVRRDKSFVITKIGGTPGYIAPEAILHSIVTKRCDIYSYGIVLLELVGGRRHFVSDLEVSEEVYLPKWAVVKVKEGRPEEVVDPRLEDMFDRREARLVLQIALLCIQDDPSARPSMVDVVRMLEGNVDVPELPASVETQLMLHASNAANALVESSSALYASSPQHGASIIVAR